MARAYSLDLRERVVAAVAAGQSLPGGGGDLRGERCERGEVVAAVPGDGQRGGLQGRRPAALCAGRRARLAAGADRREAGPDVAGARGRAGRARHRGELLRGLALLRARRASASKKSLHASEQDRPDVARRRAQWKKYQGRLDPARLVFIDETWAKTNMTRTPWPLRPRPSGWSPRCRTAAGGRSPSWPRCAATASTRPA